MKIVMMTGSAHRHGTTATLADRFQQGALDAGHEVYRFDAAFQDVHPCIGCDKCRLPHRTLLTGNSGRYPASYLS